MKIMGSGLEIGLLPNCRLGFHQESMESMTDLNMSLEIKMPFIFIFARYYDYSLGERVAPDFLNDDRINTENFEPQIEAKQQMLYAVELKD